MHTQLMNQERLNLLGFLSTSHMILGSCNNAQLKLVYLTNWQFWYIHVESQNLYEGNSTYKIRSWGETKSTKETKKIAEEREGDTNEKREGCNNQSHKKFVNEKWVRTRACVFNFVYQNFAALIDFQED